MPSKREWFLYSYLAYFAGTFLLGILIPLVPTILQFPSQQSTYTTAMNTTMYNSFSATSMIPITGVIACAAVIVFVLGGYATTRGME